MNPTWTRREWLRNSALATGLSGLGAVRQVAAQTPAAQTTAAGVVPRPQSAANVEALGYTDMAGRPAFKMTIREKEGRWHLYTGHFWHSGWSVVDVTDPGDPRVVRFVEGPANTYTFQVDLSGDVLVTGLEAARAFPNFGRRGPGEEGVVLWSVADPTNPRRLGAFRTGGSGTHRNFYGGGRYMHLAAGMPGYRGNIYVIVDVSDPANLREAGRWWVEGQEGGDGASDVSLHGPAYVAGDRAWLPYGAAGMILLDISDVARPRQISRLDFSPPFHGRLGVHSVLPLPDQGVAYVNSEDVSYGRGPANFAAIVDIRDEAKPMLLSLFPQPIPPDGAPYRSFAEKPGWSGPHNANLLQHNPDVQPQGDLFYIAHFNAGLRVYDVRSKRLPREVGHFMPPEPTLRQGPVPEGALALQSEDVLVDRRGCIYLSDKNQGVWILRFTGAL